MTREEFDKWLDGYKRAFPETAGWLNGLGEIRKKDMLDTWAFALSSVPLDDARKITAAMVLGEVPHVAAFERERTGTVVRQAALDARSRAKPYQDAPTHQPLTKRERSGLVSLAGLFAQLTDREHTQDERAAFLGQHFGPSTDPRDHYMCPQCRDSGYVEVWHPDFVWRVQSHGWDAEATRYVSVSACTCSRGRQFRERADESKRLPEYTVLEHCRCPFGDVLSEKNIADLLDWIATRSKRFVEEKGEPAFAAYNQS